MQTKSKIDIKNIERMKEIAHIHKKTGQQEQSLKYHKLIVELCNHYPADEKILSLKIDSLNRLNKGFKSLETTKKLLKINPKNKIGLFNLIHYIIR